MSWQLYPHFAVRAAGFPVELLDTLTTEALSEAVGRYGAAAAEAEALRARLLRSALPDAVAAARNDRETLRALSRLRGRIGRRRGVAGLDPPADDGLTRLLGEWAERRGDAEKLLGEVATAAARDQGDVAARLRRFAGRPDVQEAFLLLSTSFFEAARRHSDGGLRDDAPGRAFSRRLARYLQRLAAKNETHSFFGPVGYGSVDRAARGIAVDGQVGAGPADVFATHRLAAGLSEAVERAGVLPPRPRRTPTTRRDGSRLVTPRGPVPLDDLGRRLWDLADGTRTASDLEAMTGNDETGPALRRLAAAGALRPAPAVSPAAADPLAELEARLRGASHPDAPEWLGVLAGFRGRIRRFAAAPSPGRAVVLRDMEDRYQALTGTAATAGAGRMYADRTLVFEERASACAVRLGGDLADTVQARVGAALSAWAAVSAERHALIQRHAAGVFAATFGGAARAPFLDVLLALRRNPPRERAVTAMDRWMAERIARGDGRCLALTADEVEAAAGTTARPLFTSADVLLARTGPSPADLTIVLGEAHPVNLLSVFPTDYYARRDTPERAAERDAWLAERLTRGGIRLARLVAGRETKIFAYPQAAVEVELRPHLPGVTATAVADLTVRPLGDRLGLFDSRGELMLLPALTGGDETDPLTAFSVPAVATTVFGTGDALPRITVGGVVLQRQRWRLTLPETPPRTPGPERYAAMIRWWAERGLPRRVFVKSGAEPKPVYVDFASPLSVDCLAGLRASADGPLTVTEMLPDTAQCWLRGTQGSHTCEFRMLLAKPAPLRALPGLRREGLGAPAGHADHGGQQGSGQDHGGADHEHRGGAQMLPGEAGQRGPGRRAALPRRVQQSEGLRRGIRLGHLVHGRVLQGDGRRQEQAGDGDDHGEDGDGARERAE